MNKEVFMKKLRFYWTIFLFIPLISISTNGWAQALGELKGLVINETDGIALPGVDVVVVGTNFGTITIHDGTYSIKNLPGGTYKVEFNLPSFLKKTEKNVIITAGQSTELNVSLVMGISHEVTVTAQRQPVVLQEVSQNVEVLTTDEMKKLPVVNLAQILDTVSGVDVPAETTTTNMGSFISIDGYSTPYIKTMVDGVDISMYSETWSFINGYPMEMMEQVEVMKGGSSSVWGSNMGGIINFITKRPSGYIRPEITLKGSYGSWGEMEWINKYGLPASAFPNAGNMQNLSLNMIGSLQKKFGYMLGYKFTNHDGFAKDAREKSTSFFTKLGYDFNEDTYIDFLFSYGQVKNLYRDFLYSYNVIGIYGLWWDETMDMDMKQGVTFLKLSHFFTKALNFEAIAKYTWSDMRGIVDIKGDTYLHPEPLIQDNSFKESKMGGALKFSYHPGGSFSAVAGFDYYRVKADFIRYAQGIFKINQYAPFLDLQYTMGRLRWHAGVRYDYDSSFGSQVSPSLGLNITLLENTLLRFDVARTFKVPDLYKTIGTSFMGVLPNPGLDPERAWNYSIGLESQELKYVWLKLSLYRHRMTNGIVIAPVSENEPFPLTYRNVDVFIRKGYEAEIRFRSDFGLSGYIGANYNHHYNENLAQIVSWIPTRSWKTGLEYYNKKMDLGVYLRGRWNFYNMKADESLASMLIPNDRVWIFDLRLSKGFRISHELDFNLFLDIYNLTDRVFWDRIDLPTPRRWWTLGFELKYK